MVWFVGLCGVALCMKLRIDSDVSVIRGGCSCGCVGMVVNRFGEGLWNEWCHVGLVGM